MDLSLKMLDPKVVVFQGWISSMTAINHAGAFDIYPDHTNFITVIKDKVTIYFDSEGKMKEFTIQNGLLRVIDNKIEIYLGITVSSS